MTRILPSSHKPAQPQPQANPQLEPEPPISNPTDQSVKAKSDLPKDVDLLILGAGWTAGFLIPLLKEEYPGLSWAATTRDGEYFGSFLFLS